jgi:hypothetical protein
MTTIVVSDKDKKKFIPDVEWSLLGWRNKNGVIHFHPSLIFLGKARSLPLHCSHVWGQTRASSSLACKFQTNWK